VTIYKCQVRGCTNNAVTYCSLGPAHVCGEHHTRLHANFGKSDVQFVGLREA
jgi:hypothetical protein